MSLETSVLSFSILEERLISMNSVSVYIWRPPLIVGSTVKSNVNSLPSFCGLALRAARTSDCSEELRVSAEMMVIFSSLLNCW